MVLKGILGKSPMLMLYNADDFEKVYRNDGVWPIRDAASTVAYYRTVIRKDVFQTGGLIAEYKLSNF